ncbi:MAG: hypothetical protein DRP46_08690 [Candidatus Zixiibacteriota bacterium]|nr:MAG: hypothetical protein DRP46_08690 [candidate division Zixibacteria bacterium]
MRHKLIRRRAIDELTVYDLNTEQPIGQIENMTVKGMKMVVDKPVKPASIIYCKMDLPGKILGHKEVFFDAECRWCKKNDNTGKYDSGYRLRYVNAKDRAIINELIRRWMIEECKAWNKSAVKNGSLKNGFLSKIFSFGAK